MGYIFYEKAADVRNYLYCVNLSDMDKIGYKFVGTHIHKSIEVVLCYDSQMEFKINDTKGILGKNEVLIINSYDSHFYKSISNASSFIFVFSLDLLTDYDLENHSFNNIIKLNEKNFSELFSFINDSISKIDSFSDLQKKSFAIMFFELLNKENKLIKQKEIKQDKNPCSKILEFIDENYQKPLTLSYVSRLFGYNNNYFSSLFVRVVGVNFIDYVNFFRIEKVMELKRKEKFKNANVIDLIKFCGFSTPQKYYRFLKKYKSKLEVVK